MILKGAKFETECLVQYQHFVTLGNASRHFVSIPFVSRRSTCAIIERVARLATPRQPRHVGLPLHRTRGPRGPRVYAYNKLPAVAATVGGLPPPVDGVIILHSRHCMCAIITTSAKNTTEQLVWWSSPAVHPCGRVRLLN